MQTYDPTPGTTISRAAEDMVQLAHETGDTVTARFNDIEITANPGDHESAIVQAYQSESRRRHEDYTSSPEYKRQQRESEESRRLAEEALAAALKAAPPEMTLRDKEGWKKAVENNTDGYGGGVIRFAERWARPMEARMARGEALQDCADDALSLADSEGITGFMYGCAVGILAQVWTYGEELRRWHNIKYQIRTEGEAANDAGGVINPALLSIGR